MSPRDLAPGAGPNGRGGGAVRTTCPYCGVGCGVLATPDGAGGAAIAGDPDHPANFGRLCSKGSALGETLALGDRLLAPRVDGRAAGWDEAIARVAGAFSAAIRDHGPDSVAIYGSGQLLTEDYYVANKFMKGFVGSANIDTNSRLCMASSVAGHKRAFGADTVPGTYEDLEEADLIVLVGSNLAWCHPVLFQRIEAARTRRPGLRIVNVDPRRTATSEIADMHLDLAPGSDVALFNGLLAEIDARGAVDRAYADAHVTGLAEAVAAARAGAGEVAALTGLAPEALAAFNALWIGSEKVVTVYSQGVNQSSAGTDKVSAILNCHLATGRIGRPGMGPFSVTGQPNAMGGREVGGLSNMLAAHLDIENADHREAVRAFWKAPRIAAQPGLKAVDLFRACADGRIKALWVLSTNPAVSMPEANFVRDAIAATPFVAVSDIVADTDTTRLADVVLPAAGWGEKSGTVTNSDRTISRQRAFLPPPGEARPDWRILADVAAAMGWGAAFDYDGPSDVFREYAGLTGIAAGLGRDLDLTGLAGAAYDAIPPTRWPAPAGGGEGRAVAGRFFAEGGFFTDDGKARMIALAPRPLARETSAAHPFRLNTGRVRDHWHTMTRTGKSARLSAHYAEPFVEVHPEDAAAAGLGAAEIAAVETGGATALLRVLVTERTPRGALFAPMHWTSVYASAGRVGAGIASEVDPISGQPELKGAVAALSRFPARWYGFAASRAAIEPGPVAAYWARARRGEVWATEMAGAAEPADWPGFAEALFGAGGEIVASLADEATGRRAYAVAVEGALAGVLHAARAPVALDRGHVAQGLGAGDAAQALTPCASGAAGDQGPLICVCNGVRRAAILAAAAGPGGASLTAIADATGAGANCGSCRPEIRAALAAAAAAKRDGEAQAPATAEA